MSSSQFVQWLGLAPEEILGNPEENHIREICTGTDGEQLSAGEGCIAGGGEMSELQIQEFLKQQEQRHRPEGRNEVAQRNVQIAKHAYGSQALLGVAAE